MERIWYHDGLEENQGEPHKLTPGQFLDPQQLQQETGVELFFQFKAETLDSCPEYASLKQRRGYRYEDGLEVARETLPDYDKRVAGFAKEHMHPDEEIRFVVAGGGYFDIRSCHDTWIRLHLAKNDLVIIPAGTYHRFYLDPKKYIKLRRLFSEEPAWVAFNRPEAESHPARQEYMRKMGGLIR